MHEEYAIHASYLMHPDDENKTERQRWRKQNNQFCFATDEI